MNIYESEIFHMGIEDDGSFNILDGISDIKLSITNYKSESKNIGNDRLRRFIDDTPKQYIRIEINIIANNSEIEHRIRNAAIQNEVLRYRMGFDGVDYFDGECSVISYERYGKYGSTGSVSLVLQSNDSFDYSLIQ